MRLPAWAPRLLLTGVLGAAIGTAALAATLWPDAAAFGLSLVPVLGMLVFAWHFGATLRPGREPLITHYIREDFGTLPEECAPYGRALTRLWAMIFVGFAALHLAALLGHVPIIWSVGVTLLASVVIFVAEHAVRARRFPQHPVALRRTLRAMWLAGRARHAR